MNDEIVKVFTESNGLPSETELEIYGQGYDDGAESRQPEIDELKSRLNQISNFVVDKTIMRGSEDYIKLLAMCCGEENK